MCLGISTFTFWCGPTDPVAEACIHRRKSDECATRGWFWLRERTQTMGTKPECGLGSSVSQSARLSRIGGVGHYPHGPPVSLPAPPPWLGAEREGRKGPPLRRLRVRHEKRKFGKRTWNVILN